MRSTPVLQPSRVFLANFNTPAPANTSYIIPRPNPANPPATDTGNEATTPNVSIAPTVGTRILRVEVMAGDKVLGNLPGWPQTYLSRLSTRGWFNGMLADGTVVDAGRYSFKVMALRIFGDEDRIEDWDVVRTVEFSVSYKT
jgi:hypothetical protein